MGSDLTAKIVTAINKGLGRNVAARLSQGVVSDVSVVIPTGLAVLDNWVLGCGGWPCGRIMELFAEEGAGKTSLGYAALASAQERGYPTYLIETENAVDSQRAAVFGADLDKIIVMQPGHWGEAQEELEAILDVHPTNVPGVLMFDSVAGTPSKAEVEEGLSKQDGYDKRAIAISRIMRTVTSIIAEKNLAAIFINQIRDSMNAFAPPTTPGGHALKFHASIRLCLWTATKKKQGSEIVGNEVTIKAVKNKIARPHRDARVMLNYTRGWDDEWSTLKAARVAGLISNTCRDVKKAEQLLNDNGWDLGKG